MSYLYSDEAIDQSNKHHNLTARCPLLHHPMRFHNLLESKNLTHRNPKFACGNLLHHFLQGGLHEFFRASAVGGEMN